MILAVTHEGDDHARPVLEALHRMGAEAVVLDLADLPVRSRLALAFGPGAAWELLQDGRAPVDLRRVTAVWWRRPRPLLAAKGLSPLHAAFAERQAGDAIMGLFALLGPEALLVNDPWRDHAAGHKTFQLEAALRAGLRVPDTLVTSDPGAARAFLARQGEGGAVHKAVNATPADWRRTARVGKEELSWLEDLKLAPVILQERVPGVDVRVTVVGEEIFAAEIDARASKSPDDYRGHEAECRFEPCRLPAAEERALLLLLGQMGLGYAAVDFRRKEDGALYFLDLNPAGQWGFVEDRTGQPITAALAALLAGGPSRLRGKGRGAPFSGRPSGRKPLSKKGD